MKKGLKRISFGAGTLTAPLPPVMATVGTYDNANIITIGWTGILASTPPKTYISVRPSRHSHAMLRENPEFVINLPSVELAPEVDYCGIYTGAKVDKFEKCSLTKVKSEKVAPPTIAECPIALECRVCDVVNMGSHDVFVADILSVSCRETVVDEKERICFDRADLLAYAHGEYYSLGEIVGRFGFSTDKETKGALIRKSDRKTNEIKAEKSKKLDTGSACDKKEPFYRAVAKGGRAKPKSDKGAPHGRRAKEKKNEK